MILKNNKKLIGSMFLLISTSSAVSETKEPVAPAAVTQVSFREKFRDKMKDFCEDFDAKKQLFFHSPTEFEKTDAYNIGYKIAFKEIFKHLVRFLGTFSVGCIGICAATHFLGIQLATLETISLVVSIINIIMMIVFGALIDIKIKKKEEINSRTIAKIGYLTSFLFSFNTSYLLVQLSAFSILSTIGMSLLILCISCLAASKLISDKNLSGFQKTLVMSCSYVTCFCLFIIAAHLIEYTFEIVLLGSLSCWFIAGALILIGLALSTASLVLSVANAKDMCHRFGKAMQTGNCSLAPDLEAEAMLHAFCIFLELVRILNDLLEMIVLRKK